MITHRPSTAASVFLTAIFTLILMASLLAAPAMSSASTQVETVGYPSSPLPVAKWFAQTEFPTPDVKVRVAYERCPGGSETDHVLACAGKLMAGAYSITFDPDRTAHYMKGEGYGPEFMRYVAYHELGHVVANAYFGGVTETDLSVMLGYPADRPFVGDLPRDSGAVPTYIEPSEWLAEAYALCAWGQDPPARHFYAYGFDLRYRQVLPLCQQFATQITGDSFDFSVPSMAPVLCDPFCSQRVGDVGTFTAKEKFVPGTASAVVVLGRRAAVLPAGRCKGEVTIAGADVRLNFCSGVVRARNFGNRKVRLIYRGQTPPTTRERPLDPRPESRIRVEIGEGAPGPFPVEDWVTRAAVPTPSIDSVLIYGSCTGGTADACTSNFNTGRKYLIWLVASRLGEPGKDVEYFRALFYRSIGTLLTLSHLGPRVQDEFKVMLGFPVDRDWAAFDPSVPPNVLTPARAFAEAYATCAWGGDRPPATVRAGFERTYASLVPVCARITSLMDAGEPLAIEPEVQPPATLCGAICQRRLVPRKVWLSPPHRGSATVVVSLGRRAAVLTGGCRGVIRIGKAKVRVDQCGPTVRARSVGKGRPLVRVAGYEP